MARFKHKYNYFLKSTSRGYVSIVAQRTDWFGRACGWMPNYEDVLDHTEAPKRFGQFEFAITEAEATLLSNLVATRKRLEVRDPENKAAKEAIVNFIDRKFPDRSVAARQRAVREAAAALGSAV